MKTFRKLVIFDNILLTPKQKERLLQCARVVELYFTTKNPIEIVKKIGDAEAVITCWTELQKEVLEKANIRYIGFWGHWWKNRIDEETVKAKGIHLDYIPDYGTDAVVELTWCAILTLMRRTDQWIQNARKEKFTYEDIKEGKELWVQDIQERLVNGKTLGIVGMGRIGERVARIGLMGFGTNVVYYSRTRKQEIERLGARFVSPERLFKESDIVSLHLSHDAPENFITRELVFSMKPGALFIQTSASHAVDQKALMELLKTNKIKAFLDVFAGLLPEELKSIPNCLYTYRLGWFSQESILRKGETLVRNIENFLRS